MKFERSLVVPVGREKLWDLVMDVVRVGKCFPGVEQVTAQDDQRYEGMMRVRVGPVTLNMAGTILVLEQDRERWHASMRLEGHGPQDRRLCARKHAARSDGALCGRDRASGQQRRVVPREAGRVGPAHHPEEGGLGDQGVRVEPESRSGVPLGSTPVGERSQLSSRCCCCKMGSLRQPDPINS